MRSAAVVIACLALGSYCWADARAVAGQEVKIGGMRSLKQGNACGNFELKFDTDFASDNPMNNGKEAITGNSEECCALCTNTDGCKTWTRIKNPTRNNAKGECWLRDHTPEATYCNYCESGTVKDANDFLDDCENNGKAAGGAAGRGACSTLTSICPPPTEEDKQALGATIAADQMPVQDVVERICKVLFENQCQSAAFGAVSNDAACNDILTYGPGKNAENCPDFSAAHAIFEAQLEKLCESQD